MLPKILLVDDIKSNIILLEKYLEELNIEIDSCILPQEAKKLIDMHLYSLMIFDVQMPILSGYELANYAMSSKLNSKTPIIFLTGIYYDSDSEYKGYETGAVDFLTKPLKKNILLYKVKIFLELYNQKNELHLKSELLEEYIKKLKDSEKNRIKVLIEGEDKERKRIARELHDGLGQYLSAASMNFNSVAKDIEKLGDNSRAKFDTGLEFLKNAIDESRTMTRNLIPKSIDDFGLIESLKSLIQGLEKNSGFRIRFLDNLGDIRLKKQAEINLFRISQECLNNAIKHSGASEVVLQIFIHSDLLCMTYEDNGIGFNISDSIYEHEKYGIQNMNNRTIFLNGTFEIDSNKEKGTIISVEVPLKNISL